MSISETENHQPDWWHVKGKFTSDTDETMRSMHIVRDQRGELVAAFVTKQDAITGAAAPRLLYALKQAESVIQQHNLLSTASEQERRDTISRFTNWWNTIVVPAIAEAEGRADR